MSPLYIRISDLANENKISLAQLERTLQFSNGIISTWKKSTPSTDKVEKVANYFNTTTDYLLGRTNNPHIPGDKDKINSNHNISWSDLGMPYGGDIPESLKGYYKAMAEQYVKEHPEMFKGDDK